MVVVLNVFYYLVDILFICFFIKCKILLVLIYFFGWRFRKFFNIWLIYYMLVVGD